MKYTFLFILSLISVICPAQVSNDDCSGLIDLGTAPICDGTVYSNIGATPFDIGMDNEPPCFAENPPQNDVWFSFNVVGTTSDLDVTIESSNVNGNNEIKSIQAAVYRGFCSVGTLALRDCFASTAGEQILSFSLTNLSPGETYFIRADNFGGDANEGDFTLCLEEAEVDQNIDEGSSNACSGILYDSGGPDADYGPNENHTFTICPDEIHQCIQFDLQYFNIEGGDAFGGGGEQLIFYDGADTNAPIVGFIGEDGFTSAHGGGGVCYSVFATECLTIQFISNGSINLEGFAGSWECFLQPCQEISGLTIENGISEEQIEDALSTPFTQVDVVNINCSEEAYGTFFSGENNDLGLGKGLVLTSGLAANAVGPNISNGISDDDFDLPEGDSDLDMLSELFSDGTESFDACIIEVDVFANTNELKFEYIFGSDEYAEWVGSFNDIFALLLSGPGITDGIPEIGGQKNLATLPDGTFVEINNVNNGLNWQYYRNNTNGQTSEYDGLTSDSLGIKKSLTARSEVTACETYRLKFAIADRGDASFDSGVFISEISAGAPVLEVNFSNGLDYFVESCNDGNDVLVISISDPLEEDITFTVEIEGSASLNDDYTLALPSTLTFPAGETTISFPITIIDDAIDENDEDIIIKLTNDFGCGSIVLDSLNIPILDKIDIDISLDQDTLFTCDGVQFELQAEGGVFYDWEPDVWLQSADGMPSASFNADQSGWISVLGGIDDAMNDNCVDSDSIFVSIIDPEVLILPSADSICFGDTIFIKAMNNVSDSGILWGPEFAGIDDPTSASTFIYPILADAGRQYTVTVDLNGCTASDTLDIWVDAFDVPLLTPLDTTVCQGESYALAQYPFPSMTTQFEWTPDNQLSDATAPDPIFEANESQVFTLNVTSANNLCAESFEFDIEVLTGVVEILGEDGYEICLGESVTLTGESENQSFNWSPSEIIQGPSNESSVTFTPTESGFVYLSQITPECQFFDSVFIQVDSLPDLSIMAVPDSQPFCFGEIVSLFTENFDGALYPGLTHQWSPSVGIVDFDMDQNNLNVGLIATESQTYIRTSTIGGCSTTESINVEVINPVLELTVQDTIVCPGDSFVVDLSSSGTLENIEWTSGPNLSLSCTDCTTPEITVNGGGFAIINAEIQSCTVQASLMADNPPTPDGFISGDITIPIGEESVLTAIIDPLPAGPIQWFIDGQNTGITGNTFTEIPQNEVTEYSIEWQDEFGCTYTAALSVRVLIPKFDFPNVFTPDDTSPDDVNKAFKYVVWIDNDGNGMVTDETELAPGTEYEVNVFKVFNRWGEAMINCDDVECAEAGWDGLYKEKRQSSDTYMYVFEATLVNGDVVKKKGSVTLIR